MASSRSSLCSSVLWQSTQLQLSHVLPAANQSQYSLRHLDFEQLHIVQRSAFRFYGRTGFMIAGGGFSSSGLNLILVTLTSNLGIGIGDVNFFQ